MARIVALQAIVTLPLAVCQPNSLGYLRDPYRSLK